MGVALVCAVLMLSVFSGAPDAGAIARTDVMARAQRWVDLAVPYSQGSYFEGYRQDCSGYVSMAWRLTWPTGAAKSLATDTLPGICTPIGKDDLLPGDAIIKPKTATTTGHSVIFGGWSNASRTHYWAFEESGSHGGTRKRETPYPYWSPAGYSAYRYNGISDGYSDLIQSVAGDSRYTTAVAASKRAFPTPSAVDVVVVATGQEWPDALGGASLAGAVRGPVLLTRRTELTAEVRAEIVRLAPSRVVVLGGTSAVSDRVIEEIRATGVSKVDRISGKDRYETSAAVARETIAIARAADPAYARFVYVTTGADFPDALAVSPVAAYRARPVLLVQPSVVPSATAAVLADFDVRRVYVVGGSGVVSPEIESELARQVPFVARLSGADRYETALAVIDHGVVAGLSRKGAGLATGRSFADALAGGAAQGLSAPGSVLYLSAPNYLPEPVRAELSARRADIGVMRAYGGTGALSETVRIQAASALRGW